MPGPVTSDHFQHRPSQVDRDHREAAAGESDRVPACSAAQIHQTSRNDEVGIECVGVCPEQRVVREVGILLGGQPRRVGIFPKWRVDPFRQSPGRRNSGKVHQSTTHDREMSNNHLNNIPGMCPGFKMGFPRDCGSTARCASRTEVVRSQSSPWTKRSMADYTELAPEDAVLHVDSVLISIFSHNADGFW